MVGVINDIEDFDNNYTNNRIFSPNNNNNNNSNNYNNSSLFVEFKRYFKKVKKSEKEIFDSWKGKDGSVCNNNNQCTTTAVFSKMEEISFKMYSVSMRHGESVIINNNNYNSKQKTRESKSK